MKRAALALIPFLLFVVVSPRASAVQAPTGPVTIPFDLATRHIMVKVRVNNSRPLSFVLDTGAHLALVRAQTAAELGLSLYGSVNSGGAGAGTMVGHRVRDARWTLVGLEGFSQPVTLALPFPALPAGLGQDVDGIIGGEFLREFVVEFDYQARVMTLHDRKKFEYRGKGHTLPLEFNSDNHPVVRATVTPVGGKPIEDRFVLDLGSGAALILHSPFVDTHGLLGPQSKTIRAIGMGGAGGRSVGRVGRVSALTIGPFTINEPLTTFSQDQGGAFADRSLGGNIGAQIASRFRTILDYGRRRIILEPSATFGEPFDRASSGMAVRAEGADYRTFRVREVLEDSPATEAGVREGDVITSIDGVAAEKFTLTLLLETLQKPSAQHLTIRRGEETIKLVLRASGIAGR